MNSHDTLAHILTHTHTRKHTHTHTYTHTHAHTSGGLITSNGAAGLRPAVAAHSNKQNNPAPAVRVMAR